MSQEVAHQAFSMGPNCEPVTRMLLHILGPIDNAIGYDNIIIIMYFPRSNGLKYDTLVKCATGEYTSSGFSQVNFRIRGRHVHIPN